MYMHQVMLPTINTVFYVLKNKHAVLPVGLAVPV
jgi:hypothetical protein